MNASIEVLKQFHDNKILVIGEMLELGKYSKYYHEKLAYNLQSIDDATIYFIGNKKLHNIMMKYKNITCYERINTEIIQDVLNTIENNNILFLKGSHSINLGMFLEYLKQYND